MVEKHVGKDQGSTKLTGSCLNLGLSDYVEEFFTGITHDKNMARMAEFLDTHSVNLEADCPDFHSKFGLSQKESLQDYFGGKKIE